MSSRGHSLDDLHGSTVVARIAITMNRAGMCKVEGSITDREFAHFMLDTARDVVNSYHGRAKLIDGKPLIVPAYDTALVGTEAEKKLLAARDELSNAMSED
jgi:hypothetical protein